MANGIPVRQNEQHSLDLLAAQWKLYGRAKWAAGLQVGLVVVLPAALLVAVNAVSSLKPVAAAVSLAIAVLDAAMLDRWKLRLQRRAATVQELFDCKVMELEWPSVKGRRPDREDVAGLSAGADFGPFRNWYPPAVGDLPLHAARVVCQRSNCRWDSKLRRFFRTLVLGFAIALLLLALAVAVLQDLLFEDFILRWLAPIVPIALWAFREAFRQTEAADRAERLKEFGDDLWARTMAGAESSESISWTSRRLQDELFEHRQRSPLVFDWFYWKLRPSFETQMHSAAEAMVEDAKASGLI
jgi:hypothetical protein